jgi:hypothetical protein
LQWEVEAHLALTLIQALTTIARRIATKLLPNTTIIHHRIHLPHTIHTHRLNILTRLQLAAVTAMSIIGIHIILQGITTQLPALLHIAITITVPLRVRQLSTIIVHHHLIVLTNITVHLLPRHHIATTIIHLLHHTVTTVASHIQVQTQTLSTQTSRQM